MLGIFKKQEIKPGQLWIRKSKNDEDLGVKIEVLKCKHGRVLCRWFSTEINIEHNLDEKTFRKKYKKEKDKNGK
jgi:hypothetical protein